MRVAASRQRCVAAPLVRAMALATAIGTTGAALVAQSYVDIIDSRNPGRPFSQILMIEAGAIGTAAKDNAPERGLADDISWDARAYYRNEAVGTRKGTLEFYAGRDGLFAGFNDGKLVGDDTVTRLEFRGRPFQFYRDGFYRGDTLVPNGFYEGSDYEGYVGFGKGAQDGIYVEFGGFYKAFDFDRSELTPVTFTIPKDYNAYGGRLYVEQSAVQMDRRRGTPMNGAVLTLIGEREWNDSRGSFGTALFSTELPNAVWRARGRLEWYIAGSDSAVWEIFANGGWQDEKDRLQNTEGQRPLGNIWADGQLRLRLHVGESFVLTPFLHLQYSKVPTEDGFSSTKDFFFGAGAEAYLHFGSAVSLHAWYSYLDNENRPSIRVDRDVHGQHMAYVGMLLRIGSQRR